MERTFTNIEDFMTALCAVEISGLDYVVEKRTTVSDMFPCATRTEWKITTKEADADVASGGNRPEQ